MFKIIRRIDGYLLLFVALTISCSAIVGCEYIPESTFQLASESRLPKWISLPPGLTRADVSITMSYYDSLWGSNVKFTLQDKKGRTLTKVYGKEKGTGPLHLKHSPQEDAACDAHVNANQPAQAEQNCRDDDIIPGYYPAYEIITVNGITDVIEHRKMEPIFYITDDPAVWKELGVGQK
jgi:hypothetical protein